MKATSFNVVVLGWIVCLLYPLELFAVLGNTVKAAASDKSRCEKAIAALRPIRTFSVGDQAIKSLAFLSTKPLGLVAVEGTSLRHFDVETGKEIGSVSYFCRRQGERQEYLGAICEPVLGSGREAQNFFFAGNPDAMATMHLTQDVGEFKRLVPSFNEPNLKYLTASADDFILGVTARGTVIRWKFLPNVKKWYHRMATATLSDTKVQSAILAGNDLFVLSPHGELKRFSLPSPFTSEKGTLLAPSFVYGRRALPSPVVSGELSVSRDGSLIAIHGLAEDGSLRKPFLWVWDIATQSEPVILAPSGAPVASVLFNLEHRMLFGNSNGELIGWSLETGQIIRRFRLQKQKSSEPRRMFQFHPGDPILSMAFSPNGTSVIGGSLDGFLAIWDLATGKRTALYNLRARELGSLEFSPDGGFLGVGGYRGYLKIFKTSTLPGCEELRP